MRRVMSAGFLAFAYVLPGSAGVAELKQETSRLLTSTRVALTNKCVAAAFGVSPSVKQLSTPFFLVAPSSGAVQNEGHSTIILPMQERILCAPQKS